MMYVDLQLNTSDYLTRPVAAPSAVLIVGYCSEATGVGVSTLKPKSLEQAYHNEHYWMSDVM